MKKVYVIREFSTGKYFSGISRGKRGTQIDFEVQSYEAKRYPEYLDALLIVKDILETAKMELEIVELHSSNVTIYNCK